MRAAILAVLVALSSGGCLEQVGRAALDTVPCADLSGVQSGPGEFQYGGAVSCKTASESHEWPNPAPAAAIQWGGAVETGTLVVRVLDGVGREVFAIELDAGTAAGEQGITDPGAPTVPPLSEPWTVEVEFRDFTGAMGLQLRSAP